MAPPAEPLLASALWTSSTAAKDFSEPNRKEDRLSTGCKTIDKALEDGLDYGQICCISGESETGSRELVQALIVSQLLSSPTVTATVIDTGLSLDVRRLHQALSNRLGERSNAAGEAAKMLDRVNMMKVFDFVGMTESIAELKDRLGGSETVPHKSPTENRPGPRPTIGDSEDEASDDEILDGPSNSSRISDQRSTISAHNHLLIIDSLTQVTAPLLKANYTRGQGILSSFMRTLSHLTRTYSICTVLVNGVTSYANTKEESPSIFSSCTLQPALGRVFMHALDVHFLVHQVTRTNGKAERVFVVEVLQDRYGGRTGKWAAFKADDNAGGLMSVS